MDVMWVTGEVFDMFDSYARTMIVDKLVGRISSMSDAAFVRMMAPDRMHRLLSASDSSKMALMERLCATRDLSWVTGALVEMFDLDQLITLMKSEKLDTMPEEAFEMLAVRAMPDTA